MKKYIFILNFIFLICYANVSSQTADETAILKQEVQKYQNEYANTRTLVNDSLVVYLNKDKSFKSFKNLKETLVNIQLLTKAEAEEIFGNNKDSLYFSPASNYQELWTIDYFKGLKVKLFTPKKGVLNNYHIFSFSDPIFRKDNKFAMILSSSRHEGGVLTFYKNTGTGWVLYKSVQLYYI